MAEPAEIADRRARILAKLSELGLELACDLQASALAAEDLAAKERLALAFHRVSRSLRQTLALEARLERDAQRQVHEDLARAEKRRTAGVEVRKAQVRAGVERMIYCEIEAEEAEMWLDDLTERLDAEALDDDFTDEDVDAHIERLAKELGLSGSGDLDYVPRAWRPPRGAARPRIRTGAFADLLGPDRDDAGDTS